jgi:hypothetical protein
MKAMGTYKGETIYKVGTFGMFQVLPEDKEWLTADTMWAICEYIDTYSEYDEMEGDIDPTEWDMEEAE